MSPPRLAGPWVALVPAGARSWDVVVAGTRLGSCGWRAEPDTDGVVGLQLSVPADDDARIEALGVLLAWTTAQPDVRGCVLPTAPDVRDAALLLGMRERPGQGLVSGRVPVQGRHVC